MDDQRISQRAGDNLGWLNLFVAVVTAMFVLARTLEIAGCDDQCNFPVLGIVTRGFWITDLIVFTVTTAIYFLVRSRHRSAWLVPAIGIAITVIAFLTTFIVMSDALVDGTGGQDAVSWS